MPIIFLTTESDADMKQEAKAAGATGWITKPFQQDQLLAVVRKVLGHMSHTDPAQTYRQEAADLLEQLEQALLDLEHRPDDADLVNTAFRALHTIKGSGAMFGFDAVAAFTHHVETAFDRVRKGEVAVAPRADRGDAGGQGPDPRG